MTSRRDTPSSAYSLFKQLEKDKGISREEITPTHIQEFYEKMVRIRAAADFSTAKDILLTNQSSALGSAPVCGVIVETRKHFAFELVVLNIVRTCNIPVQIFHGTKNLDYIMSTRIARLVESGQVTLNMLDTEGMAAKTYNGLMLSTEFWNQMIGRGKILVFQTDSLCCNKSDYVLNDFSEFDYIGCSWNRNRWTRMTIDGGSGGFSLRDWNLSTSCLSRFPPSQWQGGEDGYFAFHLELMGGNVASADQSAKFGTQDHFLYRSFGAHKISQLEQQHRQKFLQYCPQSKLVFPRALSSEPKIPGL